MIAFSWYGGKTSHLNWLLPIVNNVAHKSYVESFGGSAAVLLNKEQSLIETYNDIYGDVVNFFKVLRDHKDELLYLIELTPYSREEFAISCTNDENDNEIEKARKFFIRARQVRTGLASVASPGRWAYVKKDSRRGMSLNVSRWLGGIEGLDEVCNRLKQVQIENLDALDVIKRYDTSETLHYIDPPYMMDTRTGGVGYAHEFTNEQHIDLLNLITTVSGKVILSGYSNDIYSSYLVGWNEYKQDAKYSASTRQNGNSYLRQEVIWTNFKI
jgi:DNA adenine methylase